MGISAVSASRTIFADFLNWCGVSWLDEVVIAHATSAEVEQVIQVAEHDSPPLPLVQLRPRYGAQQEVWMAGKKEVSWSTSSPWDFYKPFLGTGILTHLVTDNSRSTVRMIKAFRVAFLLEFSYRRTRGCRCKRPAPSQSSSETTARAKGHVCHGEQKIWPWAWHKSRASRSRSKVQKCLKRPHIDVHAVPSSDVNQSHGIPMRRIEWVVITDIGPDSSEDDKN
jgi:hypothetical protein